MTTCADVPGWDVANCCRRCHESGRMFLIACENNDTMKVCCHLAKEVHSLVDGICEILESPA